MALNWPIAAGLLALRRTAARARLGTICLKSSSHLRLKLYSKFMKPVTLPPGRAMESTIPAPTGSETVTNTIGTVRVIDCRAVTLGVVLARTMSGASAMSSAASSRSPLGALLDPADVKRRMLTPSVQPDCCRAFWNAATRPDFLGCWISSTEHANSPHLAGLRARCKRPGNCRPKERDEFAPPHSITSSARAISAGGMVTPSVLAVLRLMRSSILVACWTGSSAGFSPLKSTGITTGLTI